MLVAVNQLAGEQGSGNSLVQAFNTPRPFTHGAQHLKRFEGFQHFAGPRSPAGIFKARRRERTLIAQNLKIMPIAFGFCPSALQRQTLEGPVLLALERQGEEVGVGTRRQQRSSFLRQLLVDPARQLADAAAFTEAP